MRWSAIQKEMDDSFDSPRKMRRFRRDAPFREFRGSSGVASFLIFEQTSQRERTQTHT